MKARARTAASTLVLVAAAAAAVLLARWADRRGEAEKERKASEELLLSFDRARVRQLDVRAKGGSVRLVRTQDGWRISAPVEAEADRYAADAILDKVAGVKRRAEVAGPDAGLAPFGLDHPSVRVTATLEDGGTRTLALGEANPFDGSIYARAGDGPVVAVGSDARWPLEKDLFDLRDKRLLSFEDRDLRRVEVSGPGRSYALEREGDRWMLAAPVRDRADAATVGRILGSLRGLRATRFFDEPGPDRAQGLDRPRWKVRLVGPAETVRSVEMGQPPGAGGAADLRARVSPPGTVAAVAATSARDLDVDLLALRDKTVLALDREKVAAVRFETPSGSFEIQKRPAAADAGAGDDWVLTSPRSAPARRSKVSSVLWALSSLAAVRFADESGRSAAAHGLEPPSRTVTLLDAAGERLGRLELGKESGERVFVRAARSPRILEVEKSRLADLPASAADLEEKPAADGGSGG